MKTFLEKAGLETSLIVEISITKSVCINALKSRTKVPETGFRIPFLSTSDKLQGTVTDEGFSLKGKETYWNQSSDVIAKGIFNEYPQGTKIVIKIGSKNNRFAIIYSFIIAFVGTVYLSLFISILSEVNFLFIIFLVVHGLFMLGLPVMIVRYNVSSFKKELMAEFRKLESSQR